jgi:predicted nuclease of predicted toxin-antitoxin system
MTIWVDAQLPPSIAPWIASQFPVDCVALRDLDLRDAEDTAIFAVARDAGPVVMTKDYDFVSLQNRFGAPPPIIWVTCGNSSNARLREILTRTLGDAITLLDNGEILVEVSDSQRADTSS